MSVDLAKWREMEAQCTGGEWFYKRHTNEDMNAICFTYSVKEWDLVCAADHAPGEYDGEAICYFRNHAKEMADEVERLRNMLRAYAQDDHDALAPTEGYEYCGACNGFGVLQVKT